MASFEVVSVSQKVSPEKCHATGKGLEVAKVGKRATAVLHVVDNERIAYTKPMETPICELVSESTGEKTDCSVKKTEASGRYEISYQATSRGRHQLHIKVEGEHIIGSPFHVTAHVLGTPIKTITRGRTDNGEWHDLNRPYGVAVNNGNIIVAEQEGHCVSVFNPAGEIILRLGSKGSSKGKFDYPRGVTVDDEDNILVVDAWNKRIQKFSSGGIFIAATQLSKKLRLDYPAGIAIHPHSQMLYVADNNNHCIKILNPDLTFSNSFGSYGSGDGQFKNPYDVAFDSIGNVYVADKSNHRIQVFRADSEGMYLRQFGSEGSGNGKLSSPTGICIDKEGVVYVTEYDNCRVSLFKCDGEFLTSFGSRGHKPGQFQSPYGIALDEDECIYVADLVNDRIQVF